LIYFIGRSINLYFAPWIKRKLKWDKSFRNGDVFVVAGSRRRKKSMTRINQLGSMIDGGGSGSGKVTLMAVVGQLRTMRNREALNRIFLASAAETSLCFYSAEPLINLIELHSWRRKSDPRSLT
jgi:hypothetical protein